MADQTNRNVDNRKSAGGHMRFRRAVCYIVLVLVSIMCLFWFYVLLINATRSHGSLITSGFTAVPGGNLVKNFDNLFHSSQPVLRGMVNSILVSGLTAALCVYFSAMTAYALHAYDFALKNVLFTFILAIMMIPTQVTALGFLQLVRGMKLEDNFIPLVVPAIASPVVFFYMKQYMESTLPLALLEAARIDGAGEIRIFNSIVIPLMKPALAVQAIFSFVSSWNNYFTPQLILHDSRMKTLPILIANLRSADFLKFDMGQVYAMIAFSIFPVIVVYLILSKYIVSGVALGGVKG